MNSCFSSSLASAFSSINQIKAANALSLRIKESLKSEVGNRIHFATDIMINNKRNKGEVRVYYQLIKHKMMGDFKILEDISENVTLVQFMDSLVNVNHAISVVGNWIFDSNYGIALVLNRASLDMVCAPSVGGEQNFIFEKVYYDVKYISNVEKLKKL